MFRLIYLICVCIYCGDLAGRLLGFIFVLFYSSPPVYGTPFRTPGNCGPALD